MNMASSSHINNHNKPRCPFFSIIMPTYNSEKTLETALKSISMQTLYPDDIEIFVIDGGSTDKTVEIASKYNANILHNEKRLPEYAKMIGLRAASGHFIVKQDSDEEWTDTDQLKKRKEFLIRHPNVKVMLPNNVKVGDKSGIATQYSAICGDPFSYFLYRPKDSILETYRLHITDYDEARESYVLHFSKESVRPIADSGTTTTSLDYILEEYDASALGSITFACTMTEEVLYSSEYLGCIASDAIIHHNHCSFSVYLSKLRFRVINNLFHKNESGFSSREQKSLSLSRKKYLFLLYALTVLGPLIDGLILSFKYKNIRFILHFVYVYYVCGCIAYYLVKGIVSKKPSNQSYG